MERSEILAAMGGLKLFGMKAAYDEIVATAVKRQHEPHRIIGDLLAAELSEKQARSMRYQLTIAKLPFAKEIDEFDFADTPVNATLVHDLAGGGFLALQRNLVLVGGTGSGENSPGSRHRPRLHPWRCPRPLLQCRRPGQPPRRRSPHRAAGAARRPSLSPQLRDPR